MAYSPISGTVPKYESGQTLKAYIAGTSTLLQMATDSAGGTLVNYVVCNASGYPAVSGNVIIPHVNASYKLALYPTEAAAIANSGAIWSYDNITPTSIQSNLSFSGNTISSTNTNGDITLDPNGSGAINLSAAVVGSSSVTASSLILTGGLGSYTGTGTGFASPPTTTIYYRIVGGVVTLEARSPLTGTSNAGTLTITGAPAAIRPAASCGLQYIQVTDNGSNVDATITMNSTGTLSFSLASGAAFTSSGTKAVPNFVITYMLTLP